MRTSVRLRTVTAVVVFVLGFTRALAAQQQASVRLDYERAEGAGACPGGAAISSSVAERLGYEPFDDAAAETVKVTVRKKDRGLQARIERLAADGTSKAERVLSSRRSDCGDLSAAMALAIAIAIDPFRATAPRPEADARPPPPAQPTGIPAAPPPSEKQRGVGPSMVLAAPPPPRVEPAPKPISARIALGLVGGIGSAPVRSLGVTIQVAARRADLSMGFEGRADFPASVPLQVGQVSTSLLVASLVPCVHWRFVAGCGLLTGGALRAAGHGLVDSRQVTDPYIAVGARVALDIRIVGKLYLIAHGDVSAPLVATELQVGGEELWTTPPLTVLGGLGLGMVFP
jgi:hypothetical protein